MANATDKKRAGRYGKVYSDLLTDPKVLALMQARGGHRAFAVHAFALAWCALHLTDGHIPTSALSGLWGKRTDADNLVAAGLWEPDEDGDGWRIVGYGDANLTRLDVRVTSLKGQIDRCRGWITRGRDCSCGHHTSTGELVGDPIGDLARAG